MAKSYVCILAFALFAAVSALPLRYQSTNIDAKELAGPVSEFADNQLPLPEEVTQFQLSAFVPLWVDSEKVASLSKLSDSVIWQGDLVVDSSDMFQFSFLCPLASDVVLSLLDPNGNNVDLSTFINGVYAIGGTNIPETSWSFTNPIVGVYTLTITSVSAKLTRTTATDEDTPFGYVIVLNVSPLNMAGHLSTYNMQQGQQVGLVAMIVEESETEPIRSLTPAALRSKATQGVVIEAMMAVTLPDGTEEEVQMYDDGLHGDFEANDGVYGGLVSATEVGTYQAQAFLKGKKADGTVFLRTTQHLISSVPDALTLLGTANGVMTDSQHMTISFDVTSDSQMHPLDQTFRAYAEVWGKDSNGNDAAACWIGGITQITNVNNADVMNLVLNVAWLSLAGLSAPLTLKNVVVQESQSFIPLSAYSSIRVQTSATTHAMLVSSLADLDVKEITKEMKEGVMPQSLKDKKAAAGTGSGSILLLHGYCSGTNPFADFPADWTNAYYFLRPKASDTHDDFSKYVIAFAEENNLAGYSIVGHSQGGIVGAHLKNFYFSGLDLVENGRSIQSIGSPYEGCSAAGSSANLGSVFGVGCGTNFDLSLDGSRLWEPSVTRDTRASIYYFTTTYKQGTWFGDSCSAAMNMILEWPNDGTSEIVYTDIKYANNMGNTQLWCHTTAMNYPAQYYDHTRNQAMNAAAAR